MDRSIVLIKPDGIQRGIIGEVIKRFEQKGLHLVGLKMISLTDSILNEWYAHHKDKEFFRSLKEYMTSYPVVAMLWEGIEAAKTIRIMLGPTLGRSAAPGTIRGDFAMSQQYNLVHASENVETAQKEQSLVFKDNEIFSWEKLDLNQIYAEEEIK